jgi:prophage regulatory protein
MALLRLPEVMRLSGYSRSMLYSLISQGLYPKPLKIGERAVAWPSQEVERMVESIISQQSLVERRELVRKLEVNRGISFSLLTTGKVN